MKWADEDLPYAEPGELVNYYAMTEAEAIQAPDLVQAVQRQAYAHELLELHQTFIETKDWRLIPRAVYLCAMGDFSMPRWLTKAYVLAYRKVNLYHDADQWDQVLGRPHPKGSQRHPRQQRWKFQAVVYNRIMEIKKTDPKAAIDGYLFEVVGRELGIGGKTLTEEYFYAEKKRRESWKT